MAHNDILTKVFYILQQICVFPSLKPVGAFLLYIITFHILNFRMEMLQKTVTKM